MGVGRGTRTPTREGTKGKLGPGLFKKIQKEK